MTLVSNIITDAYRESNLIRLGASPNTNQQTEGLTRLQAVVRSTLGGEAGENFSDWPLGTFGRQYTFALDATILAHPQINSRLIATATEAKTVYLPLYPSDGSRIAISDPFARLASFPVTLDGNGRTIEGSATLVLDTASLSRSWFYRADQGGWVRVTDIALDQDLPFPEEFDDYFVTVLAMRINPRYGKSIGETTVLRLKQMLQQFQNRYLQSAPLQINTDLDYRTRQSYNNFYGSRFDTTDGEFYRGWPF